MSMITIAVLLVGALAGGFVSGLAGFGTALMALGIWLYVVTPDVAVQLVLICSIIAQTWTMPSIWRSIDFKLVLPFLVGGLAGVPIGTWLVAYADPRHFKLAVGILLLIFPTALYLQRRPMAVAFGGKAADTGIGFAGGVLGGLAGLSGPIPILWASVRGLGKDERRGLFQTFNWTILTAALVAQGASGLIKRETLWLALVVFPATIGGAWLGTRAYRVLSDGNFRDVVLGLLFLSGVTLVWSSLGQLF
ncbi:MAG TPA: sulfite exporter TauE/SafE family protein [Bradyrhizobium sp.]|nr:sulfite exporter TauE/SafE family protein [Bradyrhizobium sp.]